MSGTSATEPLVRLHWSSSASALEPPLTSFGPFLSAELRDHVISKDLMHWQRLHPIRRQTSSIRSNRRAYIRWVDLNTPKENGGPVFYYDAPDRIPKNYTGCGTYLSIARLSDPDDQYLQSFTRRKRRRSRTFLVRTWRQKAPQMHPLTFQAPSGRMVTTIISSHRGLGSLPKTSHSAPGRGRARLDWVS